MSPRIVLIPHRLGGNIYVQELAEAYRERGFEVVCDPGELYFRAHEPTLVHVQWPEEHYRWGNAGRPGARAARFLAALSEWKRRRAAIAWTVHNLAPHGYENTRLDHMVYQQVANRASVIVHHCENSKQMLRQVYACPSTAKEVVSPHGAYFGYQGGMSQSEAREAFGLPREAYIFLSFGAIHPYKGLDSLLAAYRRCNVPRKYLLIAGAFASGSLYQRLKVEALKRFARDATVLLRYVDNGEVQPLVAASDALVLSHVGGLNSGIAVLGMTFGRPVVGPRLGCIDSVLEEGMNVVYEPGRPHCLVKALEHVATLNAAAAEAANVRAARAWTWTRIVDDVLAAAPDAAPDAARVTQRTSQQYTGHD